jgi:hypothetical protein
MRCIEIHACAKEARGMAVDSRVAMMIGNEREKER